MNGFLILNKPTGTTSSNLVVFVRRRLPRGTAVGHGGTLDPDASGVLPICVGQATRLFDYIIDKKKTYVAQLQLGQETDTQDASGTVLKSCPVTATRADVERAAKMFVGDIEQVPPMYSAIKKDGQRLYRLARQGETVEVAARRCRVDAIEILAETGENRYCMRVECGKGVYIRTLCHDIGRALGCGGHMAALERTRAGIFDIADALTPEEVDRLAQAGELQAHLIAPDAPLQHLPRVDVDARAAHAVKNGNILKPQWLKKPAPQADALRVYLCNRFAGIGQTLTDGSVRFRAMLMRPEDFNENLEE